MINECSKLFVNFFGNDDSCIPKIIQKIIYVYCIQINRTRQDHLNIVPYPLHLFSKQSQTWCLVRKKLSSCLKFKRKKICLELMKHWQKINFRESKLAKNEAKEVFGVSSHIFLFLRIDQINKHWILLILDSVFSNITLLISILERGQAPLSV